MAMDELPLEKLTISGPTLSSLLNRVSSFPGDSEGLLFGHFSHITSSSLSDDDPSPSPSPTTFIATVTGFISSATTSFTDLTTLINHHHHHNHRLIGWFSSRRRSSLRPSLREFTVSRSLSMNPTVLNSSCVFFLLTTPFPDSQTVIHTHEYKAFWFRVSGCCFDGLPIDVVNIGPAFRGHYSAFSPASQLPCLPCDFRGGSPMREDEKERESLNDLKKMSKDQKDLDSYAEGFELGNLSRLIGSDAVGYMGGVEDLYEKMLVKLDSLAKRVESSSAKVLEQENRNMKLRYKVAGL